MLLASAFRATMRNAAGDTVSVYARRQDIRPCLRRRGLLSRASSVLSSRYYCILFPRFAALLVFAYPLSVARARARTCVSFIIPSVVASYLERVIKFKCGGPSANPANSAASYPRLFARWLFPLLFARNTPNVDPEETLDYRGVPCA